MAIFINLSKIGKRQTHIGKRQTQIGKRQTQVLSFIKLKKLVNIKIKLVNVKLMYRKLTNWNVNSFQCVQIPKYSIYFYYLGIN